ncbi:hypothetical protein ACHAWF_005890 [Thalassiosira exigua]
MSHGTATTLDLHGRRLEDAISEVTLFLERIRRTVAGSSASVLFVTIITGSGSHSPNGPVLRNAVQKLLVKRGMDFSLQPGGGAFQVDALSGCDLYAPEPAICSKVLVAEQDEFHQMAIARRRNNLSNLAQASMGQRAGAPRNMPRRLSSSSSITTSDERSSSDPLPSQVASEAAELRSAVQLSVAEAQEQQNSQERLSSEYERQFQLALSDIQIDDASSKDKSNGLRNAEDDKSLLKLAVERSIEDEMHRQTLKGKEYEDALVHAIEQSNEEAQKKSGNLKEDDLLDQAMAESRALAEMERTNNTDEDLMEKVLAESRAMAKAERTNDTNDDLWEKALAESVLEEERRKTCLQHTQLQDGHTNASSEEEMLQEVIRLSLQHQENESMSEEEAIQKAIALSKQFR